MFDQNDQIVQWYIDICLRSGVDGSDIPWMDDLYLDLAVLPDMQVELLDADELADARESGEITTAEFDLAWTEANRLMEQIAHGHFGLFSLSDGHRRILLNSGDVKNCKDFL